MRRLKRISFFLYSCLLFAVGFYGHYKIEQWFYPGRQTIISQNEIPFFQMQSATQAVSVPDRLRADTKLVVKNTDQVSRRQTEEIKSLPLRLIGYVSVLLDSDLKEGNLKKIPHRESYVLDLESGQQVTLEKLLGKSREECYQLLQEAYRDKLRENPGVYYADAEEKIAALNPEKIGWYFTETAIVCYLEPYTIALPEEGYVEAELPIEDDRE